MSLAAFEQEFLDAHNNYRMLHGCAPLILSRNLCLYAASWAEHLARRNAFEHRVNSSYGENLYLTTNANLRAKDAVDAWYNEFKKYNYNKASFDMNTGHFTQVIWRNSKELGVGKATIAGKTWVVANYNPPGNVVGRFNENVPKKLQ